jgi:hypothetical protein
VNNNNCIEQLMSLLHQLDTVILVLFYRLGLLSEIHYGPKFCKTYLNIFQERLSGVGYGQQERGIEGIGKNVQCIQSCSHTCRDVVQPNFSGSGLGGHLGGEDRFAWERWYFKVCLPGILASVSHSSMSLHSLHFFCQCIKSTGVWRNFGWSAPSLWL